MVYILPLTWDLQCCQGDGVAYPDAFASFDGYGSRSHHASIPFTEKSVTIMGLALHGDTPEPPRRPDAPKIPPRGGHFLNQPAWMAELDPVLGSRTGQN